MPGRSGLEGLPDFKALLPGAHIIMITAFHDMETTIEAMRLNGLRFLTRQLRGEPVGAETSVNKLLRTRAEIEIGKLACDIEGSYGQLSKGSPGAIERGKWQRHMLSWPSTVIGGGTPNIQKNVIAERILGLPHDI